MFNLCNGQCVASVHLLFVWLDTLLSVEVRERERVDSTNPLSCLVVQLPTCHSAHKAHIKRRQSESLDSWVKPASRQPHRWDWQLHSRGPTCSAGPQHQREVPEQSREVLDLMQGAHSALSHTHRSDTRHTEANILLQVLGVVSIGAQTGINESESVEINHGRIKMRPRPVSCVCPVGPMSSCSLRSG